MITSIGSSNETLAQLLERLNSIDSDKNKSISKNELSSIEEETEFSKALMGYFDEIDNDKNGELSENEITNKKELFGNLGIPAGLNIEETSSSISEKLNSLDFLKVFDINKDGKLSKNDLAAAEDKSPLIQNLKNAFNEASSLAGESKLTGFFQNIINQYKDNPLGAITDAAKIFA